MSKMLTYNEASQRLNIPKGTLGWMVAKRKIPFVRYGPRQVRFREDDLLQWLEDRSVEVARPSGAEGDRCNP